jgi:hypothetical protein
MAKPAQILTLNVSINDVGPSVRRRIQVDAEITLRKLHHILQASFGWTPSHLHQFNIEDDTCAMLDNEYVLDLIGEPRQGPPDDRKAKLGRLVHAGQRLIYPYDFGDSWTPTAHVESITELPEKLGSTTLIDGAGACPPEDVGGHLGTSISSTLSSAGPAARRRMKSLAGLAGSSTPTCLTSVRRTRLCYRWLQTDGERNRLQHGLSTTLTNYSTALIANYVSRPRGVGRPG